MNKNVIMKILGEQTENGNKSSGLIPKAGITTGRSPCLEYQESEIRHGGSHDHDFRAGQDGFADTARQANSHMVFEPGKKCIHQYDTPMGTMKWASTRRVDVDQARGGRVGLSYQLDIDGRFTSSNSISVTYRTVH